MNIIRTNKKRNDCCPDNTSLHQRMIMVMAVAVICTFMLAVAKPQVVQAAEAPTVDGTNIYANGTPIRIESGSSTGTTRIKLPDGSYLQINGATEADLSSYTIYGAKRVWTTFHNNILRNTSIIMTGGKVESIYGGYYAKSSANGPVNTVVEIRGGTVTDILCAGSYRCKTQGNNKLIIKGGVIASAYGGNVGGWQFIMEGETNTIVTGGSVTGDVNGGPYVDGVANVVITGGSVAGSVIGENITNGNSYGIANGIVSRSDITTSNFDHLLQRTEGSWTVTGNPVIPAQTMITAAMDETITIPKGSTLTIANGATLTNNGTLTVLGTLDNQGTLNGTGIVTYQKTITTNTYPADTGTLLGGGIYEIGESITLEALPAEGYYFAGWYLASEESPYDTGRACSYDAIYPFVVTEDRNLVAVYSTKPVNQSKVTYTSYYGQELITLQLSSCDLFSMPEGPTRYGYTFTGWSMTQEEIIAQMQAGTSEITVTPSYTLDDMIYTITITHGNGGGDYNINDVVIATAEEPEEGMMFLYWMEDSSGKIVSYNRDYQFYATGDTSITACYDVLGTEVESKGIARITKIKMNETTARISFVTMHTVPEGCKIMKAGIIATSDASVGTSGEQFHKVTATYVRGMEWSGNAYRFTWTKKVNQGETWYVRAYLLYQDANQNEVTIYSDMEYASLNGSSY